MSRIIVGQLALGRSSRVRDGPRQVRLLEEELFVCPARLHIVCMLPSRGAGRAKRESSLRKATYVPALTATPASDSDSSLSPYDAQDDPAAVPHEDPVAPLRRVNVVLQFVGAGMLALGCTSSLQSEMVDSLIVFSRSYARRVAVCDWPAAPERHRQ